MIKRGAVFALFILMAALPAYGAVDVYLHLPWYPQSQFAGYYVALEKGFYKNLGLSVEIHGENDYSRSKDTFNHETVDFTVVPLASALVARQAGARIVNIAQIMSDGYALLMAKKKSGISTPAKMQKKRISLWEKLSYVHEAFLKSRKISYTRVSQGYSINLLLRDGVDVCAAMKYNEYIRAILSGYAEDDLYVFRLADMGFNVPEDGIYCLEETFRDNPAVCDAMAEATMEGWRYAASHQEEAIAIVMKRAKASGIPTSRIHMKIMLETIMPSIQQDIDNKTFGRLTEEAYDNSVKLLSENGIIKSAPQYRDFVRGIFYVQ